VLVRFGAGSVRRGAWRGTAVMCRKELSGEEFHLTWGYLRCGNESGKGCMGRRIQAANVAWVRL